LSFSAALKFVSAMPKSFLFKTRCGKLLNSYKFIRFCVVYLHQNLLEVSNKND